jgi:type VI secretion system protein ImpK
VEIVGYTDSQPVHTVRFSDNIELSEARANSVSTILQRAVANPARLTAYGLGDSKIIDRVNLARNRRVEIVHVRGS